MRRAILLWTVTFSRVINSAGLLQLRAGAEANPGEQVDTFLHSISYIDFAS